MLGRLVSISRGPCSAFRGQWSRQHIKWIVTKSQVIDDFRDYLDSVHRDRSVLIHCLKSCANDLTEERAQLRVGLANNMLKKLKDENISMSVEMFNCLLKVYLKNYYSFSPSMFLQKMKDEEVSPNRGTLFLLLDSYSQQGNMEGVKQILQEIQSNDIPVTEELYASLITCHAVSGDMSSALQLLDSMRSNNMEPGLVAYSSLLSGYAYNGDLESLVSTIERMKEGRMYIGQNVFLDMLDPLSRGGHSDKLPKLLDLIKNKRLMYSDLLDKVLAFASRGEIESTLSLLKYLSGMETFEDGQELLLRTGQVSLRLIAEAKPIVETVENLSVFEDVGMPLKECFETMIKLAFDSKNWEKLKDILIEMAKRDCVIKPLYVYPPLATLGMNKDIDGLTNWLKLINDFDLNVDRNMILLTLRAVEDDLTKFLSLLNDNGCINQWLPEILKYVCVQSSVELASSFSQFFAEHLQKYESDNVSVELLLNAVRLSVRQYNNPNAAVYGEIFKVLFLLCGEEQAEYLKNTSHFVVSYFLHTHSPHDVIALVRSLWENQKDIKVAQKPTCGLVLSVFARKQLFSDFCKFYELTLSHNIKVDCRAHRTVLKVAKDPGMVMESFQIMKRQGCPIGPIQYSNILSALANSKRSVQAMVYYEEMRRLGHFPSPTIYGQLINGILSVGNLPLAFKLRSHMQAAKIDLTVSIVNSFIGAFANRGELDKCKEQLQYILDSPNLSPNWRTYHSLMECYCYHGDVAGATEMLEKAKNDGFNVNRYMVSTLVETYLNQNDVEGAVEFLCGSDSKVNLSTNLMLFTECERANREELKERVRKKLIESFEINEKHVHCCNVIGSLRCGLIDKAANSVQSKGLTVEDITIFTNILSKAGMVEDIKLAIGLMEHLGLSSYPLYKSLLRGYSYKGDIRGMTEVKDTLDSLDKPDDTFDQLFDQLTSNYRKRYGKSSTVSYTSAV